MARNQPEGDRKGSVVWYIQGGSKSLSMVFFTGRIILALNNPTIVLITERNDPDNQLFDTIAASTRLLRQEPGQVENREQLKEVQHSPEINCALSPVDSANSTPGNLKPGQSSEHPRTRFNDGSEVTTDNQVAA